ncbi:MAG: UDP-N-acetylmuramate--L-alanine ligase [Saprospiraceae bacterium]
MYKNLYFIGIGGIGMSALARYFNQRGVVIYGYDKTETELTRQLELEGMSIHYEDRPDLIPQALDMVILTPAVPNDLKEYQTILERNIPYLKRSQVLGQITAGNKNIAVAGTHGKTTTSCLLAHLIYCANIPMTAFLGGIAVNYQSNYLDTGDDWMVEEADEYDRSFLQLSPDLAVIGSLDPDHLDIYGTHEAMIETYLEFARKIKQNGLLLLSDTIPKQVQDQFRIQLQSLRIKTYGIGQSDLRFEVIGTDSGWMLFNYIRNNYNMSNLRLRMPGNHNLRNAVAAIALAEELGISQESIRMSLENFKGIKRRVEWIEESNGRVLIDDYAHHPEELRAAIEACRSIYPGRNITGIFQPHLYSRTRDFLHEFAHVLSQLDQVILVELYPAREPAILGISSETIYNLLTVDSKYLTTKKQLPELLRTLQLDVVMTLGAGDLDMMQNEIKHAIFEKAAITNLL